MTRRTLTANDAAAAAPPAPAARESPWVRLAGPFWSLLVTLATCLLVVGGLVAQVRNNSCRVDDLEARQRTRDDRLAEQIGGLQVSVGKIERDVEYLRREQDRRAAVAAGAGGDQ